MNLIKKLYCGILTLSLATCSTTTILATDDSEIILSSTNVEVAAGNSFSAVLKSNGTVWTWGLNNKGQLGNENNENTTSPVQIQNLSDVLHIVAGKEHTLALKSDGTVWAWGYNNYGQLGNNSTATSNIPVQVKTGENTTLTDIVAIDAGEAHSIALKSDGTVWTWGCNINGRLGNGTQTNSSVAIQIPDFSSVAAISAGGKHSTALKNDGTVWSWGYNGYGQLGNNTTTNSFSPTQASDLNNVVSIDSGANHTLALLSNGDVYGWGRNDYGQLGMGYIETSTDNSGNVVNTPKNNYTARIKIPTKAMGTIQQQAMGIFCNENVSYVSTENKVYSTGYDFYGQLGQNYSYNTKTSIPGSVSIDGISKLSIGTQHVLMINNSNQIWGCGNNTYGQLDTARTDKRGLPRKLQVEFNDMIGNTLSSAADIEIDSGEIISYIDYENDVDVYKIVPTISGKLCLTGEFSKIAHIKLYNDTELYSQQLSKNYDGCIDVTANNTYYVSIESNETAKFKLKYKIIEASKYLSTTMTAENSTVTISGINNAGAEKDIFIKLYDKDGSLINTQQRLSGTDGIFSVTYNFGTMPDGVYQFIVTGLGTQNVQRHFYTIGANQDFTAKSVAFGNDVSIEYLSPSAQTGSIQIGGGSIAIMSVNANIKNTSTEQKKITVYFWQYTSDNVIRKKQSSTKILAPQETGMFYNSARYENFDITDKIFIIVCDGESDIPIYPIRGLTLSTSNTAELNSLHVNQNAMETRNIRDISVDSNNLSDNLSDDVLQDISIVDSLSLDNVEQGGITQFALNLLQNTGNISSEVVPEMNNSLKRNSRVQADSIALANSISAQSNTTPKAIASMTAMYDDEYEEGLFKLGTLNVESNTLNLTNEEEPLLLLIPSYIYINNSISMVDLQIVEGSVQPQFNETLSFSRDVDQAYYDSCDIFKTFTWESFNTMVPFGDALIYTKSVPEDNYKPYHHMPMWPTLRNNSVIHGKINNINDVDCFKIVMDSTGELFINSEQILGEEIHVQVMERIDDVLKTIAIDKELIDTREGAEYYIIIQGDDGIEYTMTFEN